MRLGVVFVDAPGETVWLDWDRQQYPYLGKVTWTEQGPLTLTVFSRDQTNLALLQADPTWGDTKFLLTEHDQAWVNLPQDVPLWLSADNGGGFLWASERSGWRCLERRRVDGGLDKKLTEPAHNLRMVVGVAGKLVLGLFSGDDARGSTLTCLSLDGTRSPSQPAVLDDRDGLTQANLGECTSLVALQKQAFNVMPHTFVRRINDGFSWPLPSVAREPELETNISPNPLGSLDLQGDGHADDFASVVFRPHGFDPASKRRYPVIVDVYGGPEHQQVVAAMRPYLLDQWIADQGFVVVAIDGRGTPGRGRDWERAIAGHFGSVPLEDQVAALKALGTKYPEMDMDRVGITGWSFGGYMSALAVLRRPDVFKAAVAGAPVVDWYDYDTCYTERYLGVPGAGRWPGAYEEGSLLTYARQLSRPLLVIHGTADDNVYLRHSLRLMDALFRAGKAADFLPLSNFTHMVPDPVVRTRLEERIVAYFHEHLGQPADN